MSLCKNHVVVVKHEGGMKCLFEVPDGVSLFKGQEVICTTKRGECTAICTTDSAFIDDVALSFIVDIFHASLPLKKIVGRHIVERFEEVNQE